MFHFLSFLIPFSFVKNHRANSVNWTWSALIRGRRHIHRYLLVLLKVDIAVLSSRCAWKFTCCLHQVSSFYKQQVRIPLWSLELSIFILSSLLFFCAHKDGTTEWWYRSSWMMVLLDHTCHQSFNLFLFQDQMYCVGCVTSVFVWNIFDVTYP